MAHSSPSSDLPVPVMSSLVFNFSPCFHTAERRKADIAVTGSLQVAAAACQTDEDAADGEHLFRTSFREMLYQFLFHTVDIKRGKLIDRLSTKDILTSGERQRIREQKRTDVKLNSLLMTLREKSAAEFESFLRALSETGQQSVVDVVRQALHTVGQAGHNPLHAFDSKTLLFHIALCDRL